MDARYWVANGNLNAALYSTAFDATRIVDALAGSTALERAVKSASGGLMLDRQSRLEREMVESRWGLRTQGGRRRVGDVLIDEQVDELVIRRRLAADLAALTQVGEQARDGDLGAEIVAVRAP